MTHLRHFVIVGSVHAVSDYAHNFINEIMCTKENALQLAFTE